MRTYSAIFICLAFFGICQTPLALANESVVLTNRSAAEHDIVESTAMRVLDLLDSGQTEEVWDMMSPFIANQIGKSTWLNTINGMRSASGTLQKRNLIGTNFLSQLENAPPGEYAAAFFNSSFSKIHDVDEKIIFRKEGEGWKIFGYFLSKKYKFGEPK